MKHNIKKTQFRSQAYIITVKEVKKIMKHITITLHNQHFISFGQNALDLTIFHEHHMEPFVEAVS